ncbi:HPP family protein [Brevibacillus centrosporus]|uniref:HPP family protein n=2 Tax=Brevibacillus centrosporus TaxID=54910 RepID=UPI000F09B5EE|nr:HPP family protein [Brevibacillus centrosporus]RNB69103.1 HPP family protein [Brevibacillus centrosporus]
MNVKTVFICLYLMFVYWLSLQVSFLDTLFFPALGAFCFLFVSRSFRISEMSKITLGATVSSVIGTLFFFVYPSPISLFVNVLLTIWMINRFKWNAPPIVAVSLIPFFSQSSHHWFIPLSVCAVMLGVMLVLLIAELVESKWSALSSFLVRNKVASDAEKLDIAG